MQAGRAAGSQRPFMNVVESGAWRTFLARPRMRRLLARRHLRRGRRRGLVDQVRVGLVLDHRLVHDHLADVLQRRQVRSEEHTSELQSLMRISYAVFFFKKKTSQKYNSQTIVSLQTHN